jgi:hypothetical protein
MAAITFKAFRGAVPRTNQRLLGANYANSAVNVKITSGRLDPLRTLLLSHTSLAESIKTIWRYRFRRPDRTLADNWLVFPNDADVVPSLLANDEDGRVYWTADEHEPRMTTYNVGVAGGGPYPTAWYALGIPLPTVAPTVGVTGGTTPVVSRSYAYTFVTALGEESGPSPASALISGNESGSWNLSGMQAAPPNSGTITAAVADSPSPGQVTVTFDTAFGLAAFDTITLAGVVGMTDLNGEHRIRRVSGATVVLDLATAQTYTSGGTWARNAPVNTAGMVKRIYRTAGTGAAFIFVAEIPVANTTYADTTVVLTGEVIQTANALPPPKNMRCLISLPNGCLVGMAGNEVCFSVPYQPQSWPISNRYSFVGEGVALCPAGNSVIVMTDKYPILLTGTDPEAMSPSTMETNAPCVSKRGAVDVGGGCLYPSFDGLWLAAPGRVDNMTKKLYREEEWSQMRPETFDAAFHDGQYYAVHAPLGASRRQIMQIDVVEMDSVIVVDEEAEDLYRNDYDGELYLVQGNRALRFDASPTNRYQSEWTSVEVQLDQPRNFSVAQVHAQFRELLPVDTSQADANAVIFAGGPDAVNGHLAGTEILTLEVGGSFLQEFDTVEDRQVQFTLYDGDVPVFSQIVTSARPFRLPSGYKSEVVRVGLSASVGIFSATIAESTEELARASS